MSVLPLLCLVWATTGHAQTAEEEINLLPYRGGIFINIPSSQFQLSPKGESNYLKYRPAQGNQFGVAAGYDWVGGSYSFNYPANPQVRAVEGQSQYTDFRVHYYDTHFGVELSYNRYKGYLIDNSSILAPSTLNGATYYKLPDLTNTGFGANFIYVLSPERYSLPAALDQSTVQPGSAGSFFAIGSFRSEQISNDGAILPVDQQSIFGPAALVQGVSLINFAGGIGYGYNWIPPFLGRYIFIAPTLALTLGYMRISETYATGSYNYASLGFNTHARIAIGSNTPSFYVALQLYADDFTGNDANLDISNGQVDVTIALGYRF